MQTQKFFAQQVTENIIPMICDRIRKNHTVFANQYPSYGDGNKRYLLTPNENWLASFWSGLLWLVCSDSQDAEDCKRAKALLPDFEARLDARVRLNHDLGFLFLLSARAHHLLTSKEDAIALLMRAADELYARYNPAGEYIQAWGEIGEADEAGRIIIDCMMNLPLLFFATQHTGDPKYYDAALAHAKKTQAYLVRDDYSNYHTYFFNPQDGNPIAPKTHQGYADDSLWARGQGWTVYGFTMAAEWTGDRTFIDTAKGAVERYFMEAPITQVAPYDLRLPDNAPVHPDSSADAIVAGGLLRLATLTGEQSYHEQAELLLKMLYEQAFDKRDDAQGILLHGTQHAPHDYGVDTYTIFGDYFFLEGLLRLTHNAPDFWGKQIED